MTRTAAPPADAQDRQTRRLPQQAPRVETGAVEFGDDWPGVFIRGDCACWMAINLLGALEGLPDIESSNTEQLRLRLAMEPVYAILRTCVIGPAAEMFPSLTPNPAESQSQKPARCSRSEAP